MPEPRDPLLKVLIDLLSILRRKDAGLIGPLGTARRFGRVAPEATKLVEQRVGRSRGLTLSLGNDPSAGSPTETLLRLLLPLNDRV